MTVNRDALLRERKDISRIFKYHLEGVTPDDNFHIYSVDCRGERTLDSTLTRIDWLMENHAIRDIEHVRFPVFFDEAIQRAKKTGALKNIIATVDESNTFNFITGTRQSTSVILPGYDHEISWTGIILSEAIRSMKPSPGRFVYAFKNLNEFMGAFVPEDQEKFLNKIRTMQNEPDSGRELEQFFAVAAIVRPELSKRFEFRREEGLKGVIKKTNDVSDYLRMMSDTISADIPEITD